MADKVGRYELVRQRKTRGFLATVQEYISDRSRRKRARLFFRTLGPTQDARVLDLGGATGRHLGRYYASLTNVWIADRNAISLQFAERNFGYRTVLLDGADALPFADREFDIIFCSSVIEHITGPKHEAMTLFKADGRQFVGEAFAYQKRFADEIRRCAAQYFIQTPNRYFPIEVHCWIPLVGLLPTHLQWRVINLFNGFWPRKQKRPDWALLNERQMRRLFPDAEIHREKFFIFTKSLIAIRRSSPSPVKVMGEGAATNISR